MRSLVNIKQPCSENWDTMKIGLTSRFCDNCQKNVIDFTSKSRAEIIEYLLANYNKQTCGRVYRSQLDFSNTDLLVTINALSKQRSNSNLAFFLLSMSSLILASCNNSPSSDTSIIGVRDSIAQSDCSATKDSPSTKQVSANLDSSNIEDIITGEVEADYLHKEGQPFAIAEKMPEFPGGMDSLMNFLKQNLHYPKWEKENKIEGRTIIQFTVDSSGVIKDVQIIKSVSGSKNFDKEVLRIMSIMPTWIPGEHKNEKVDVRFTLPIVFKL